MANGARDSTGLELDLVSHVAPVPMGVNGSNREHRDTVLSHPSLSSLDPSIPFCRWRCVSGPARLRSPKIMNDNH